MQLVGWKKTLWRSVGTACRFWSNDNVLSRKKLLSRQQAKRRREGWRQAGHGGDPASTQVIRVNSELRMEGKQDILRQKKLDCNLSKRQEKGCRQGDRHELILVVEFSDCY